MSELSKRTIFGALYVACIVGGVLFSPYSINGLLFIVCLLAVDEFHRLVKSSSTLRIFACLATMILCVMIMCLAWKTPNGVEYKTLGVGLILAYLPIIVTTLLDEIWNHSDHPLRSWGNFLISQVMIAAPLATLSFLYFLDKWLVLALFVLIWVNDTGAYVVGSLTAKRPQGNHKMTPHISPKKSWEGLLGGIVFTFAGALILYKCGWFDAIVVGKWGILITLFFAFLVSTFGTMGDLMESLFKRSIGVKDSGIFLPGHGGVLDRFDSILLASPVVTAFCWICYFAAPLL